MLRAEKEVHLLLPNYPIIPEPIRTTEYMVDQCKSLAEQAATAVA